MTKLILRFSKLFLRKAGKIARKSVRLDKQIKDTLKIIADNPQDPQLKSHKVNGKNTGECFSSRVNSDIRILWDYSDNHIEVLEILDIGGHSGKHKVYK
jgi:mRNA-degrading endonuclease YafQ of YafQ-DinJ toxin-antitoxin module